MIDKEYAAITSNLYGVGGCARLLQFIRKIESIAEGANNPVQIAKEALDNIKTSLHS